MMKCIRRISTIFAFFVAIPGICFSGSRDTSDYDSAFHPPTGYFSPYLDGNQTPRDVAVNAAGTTFVGMVTETNSGATGLCPAILSITADGNLNTSFGTGGLYVVPADYPLNLEGSYLDIAVASDGNLLLSFPVENGSPESLNFMIAKVQADGSDLVALFGEGGLATVAFDLLGGDPPGADIPTDLIVEADGDIVIIGSVEQPSGTAFGVARLNWVGDPDGNFNSTGKNVIDFDLGGSWEDLPWGVASGSSGEVFIVGQVETGTGWDGGVVVLNSSGTLESSFGTGGKQNYRFSNENTGEESTDTRFFALSVVPPEIRAPSAVVYDALLITGSTTGPSAIDGTQDIVSVMIQGDGSPYSGFGNGA